MRKHTICVPSIACLKMFRMLSRSLEMIYVLAGGSSVHLCNVFK